jgi:hypothetical protein
MAKFIDVTPRRLQQLVQEGVVPKCEGRGRYNPIAVNLAYIRFLRDRVQSPEASDSEFFAAKLAKLKAEREMIDLQVSIGRGQRIPLADVNAVVAHVFASIRGVIKASKLPIEDCNEIFDELRQTAERLRGQANEVDGPNGSNGQSG